MKLVDAVKIYDPNNDDDYIIVDVKDYDPDTHWLWDKDDDNRESGVLFPETEQQPSEPEPKPEPTPKKKKASKKK